MDSRYAAIPPYWQRLRAKANGDEIIKAYGVGIGLHGIDSFDVDLAGGKITARGVKGITNIGGTHQNIGGGILFGNKTTVALGSNTKVYGGQVLIDGVTDKDDFAQAYGANGVVAEETILYDASIQYNITVKAGKGGSITPAGTNGSVTVANMADAGFTIKAAEGYAIADVLVDGVSVGKVEGHTFERVSANHTIEATFVSTSPATGDDVNNLTWLWGVMALLALGIVLVMMRTKRTKE
ncbi:hypothetical protein LJC55_00320 [Eubacteriales bacterium OttesenSCG-928-N14]|nr:hypothetical protein [Eubacteriales bacterium OttesenSCG-928-N14]